MKKVFLAFLLVVSFLFLSIFAFSQTIPKSKGFVSDYENIFTPEQNANLTKMLSDYEDSTTIEIAILTIPDFESDIADFAQKTATEWGIGKKGINNGLLIVISKNKKVLRSQTGYGLEGYLPDGWLKHTGDSVSIKYTDDYEKTLYFVNKIKERIGKEGYSEDHNKELIEKNKKSEENSNIFVWMIKNVPWYVWIGIIVVWIIIFLIDPGLAINILLILLTAGKGGSSGKGFGGGKFGGGGTSSKW